MQSQTRLRTPRVGPDEGVVNIRVGRHNLVKNERRVTEVSGFRQSAKGDELADGVVVKVEAMADEDGVHGLELAHVGTALCQRHAAPPCLNAAELLKLAHL